MFVNSQVNDIATVRIDVSQVSANQMASYNFTGQLNSLREECNLPEKKAGDMINSTMEGFGVS